MSKADQLKAKILKEVREYYHLVHEHRESFVAGKSNIHYAGRVFDEREMVNLVDSSLEFWLTSGRYTEQFESGLAKYLGVRYALTVNSGSSANLVAFSSLTSVLLKERRIKKGDEVITVAAGFPTTIFPILQYGAVPVFVDIDLSTANIDVTLLEKARSAKTKAVMVAHTLGNPFDLTAVKAFCEKYQLWLVEDNCDALGSTYAGKKTGSWGDLATSSFYPPHHMTTGEGGAVYTNNPLLKLIAASFRDWGRDCWCASGKDNTCARRFSWKFGTLPMGYDHKYVYSHVGYNLKMTDMQAAVGCAQLEKLPQFVDARRKNWQILREGLKECEDVLLLPNATPNSDPSWFGFLITLRNTKHFDRGELVAHLEDHHIQTRNLFAGNFTRQPVLLNYFKKGNDYRIVGRLTNTDHVMNHSFWIGVYPGMLPDELQYMVEQIRTFVQAKCKKDSKRNRTK